MDVLRIFFYLLAPWVPILVRNWFNNFKVWQILLASIIFLLPFSLPFFLGYAFADQLIFSVLFVLFLISFSAIGWLLTTNRRFIYFACVINILTISLFYFINWQTNPFDSETGSAGNQILKVESPYYSDIEASYMLGFVKVYHARKKFFAGLLVRKIELETINRNDTCLYKGFDDKRGKMIYWDKCSNRINEP